MRLPLLKLALLFLAVPAFAQNVATLSGTVTDPSSVSWGYAYWTATLQNVQGGKASYVDGTPVVQETGGSLSSTGVITGMLGINSRIAQPGTWWQFTVCPVASIVNPCVIVNGQAVVTSTTFNAGSFISAGITPLQVPSLPGAYGYNTSELHPSGKLPFSTQPLPGQWFYTPLTDTQCYWSVVTSTCDPVVGSGVLNNYLLLAGGTMNGPIVLSGPPTSALQAADKSYVDGGSAGSIDISSFGGEKPCVDDVDQTSNFQSAVTFAGSLYTASGQRPTVTYSGNCLVSGTVNIPSGVNIRGYGAISVTTQQIGHPTFMMNGTDFNQLQNIVITYGTPDPSSDPNSSGIEWLSSGDAAIHHGIKILNCAVHNSSWGILFDYNSGTGSLNDVEIAGTIVDSPTAYSNFDGIHVAGRITDTRIHDNYVMNRGDAAIALSGEVTTATYQLSQATIQDNVVSQSKIGIDLSGPDNVTVIGNKVIATQSSSDPTTALRCIVNPNSGLPCLNVEIKNNTLESGVGASTATLSVDNAGNNYSGATNANIFGNTIIPNGTNPTVYIRGNNSSAVGNILYPGSVMVVDFYESSCTPNCQGISNVLIGRNTWLGSGTIQVPNNASQISNVQITNQNALGSITYTDPTFATFVDGTLSAVTPSVGGSLAAGSNNQAVVSVPGATGFMSCSMSGALGTNPAGLIPLCFVGPGPNEVTPVLYVGTAGTYTSQTYNIRVIP